MAGEKTNLENNETSQTDDYPQKGRIVGTAVVAVGVVLLLVLVAALVFLAIVFLMRADWLLMALTIGGVVVLLVLLSRLMRVAANQNKITKL